MNVQTQDGIVHALVSVNADTSGCHTVVCGLKGQNHSMDKPGATASIATLDPVTCLACLALQETPKEPWGAAFMKGSQPKKSNGEEPN